MEKKNNKGLICLVVILLIAVLGLTGYILVDKGVIKLKKEVTVKEKVTTEDKNDDVIVSNDELSIMKKISEVMFNRSDEGDFNSLDNQTKLTLAINLTGKSTLEVTGKEILDTVKKYFGSSGKIVLENIVCPIVGSTNDAYFVESHSGNRKYLYLYKEDSDRFVYNDEHGGHGALSDPVLNIVNMVSYSAKKNIYKYKANVFYINTGCADSICGPLLGNMYATYEDAKNDTNLLEDIKKNSKYCDGDQCDYEKVSSDYADKLNNYIFEFVKDDNNLVFKKYYKEK